MNATSKSAAIKPDDGFERYADLLELPRPRSAAHPPMSRAERAAQFGAFRALTGHEQAIEETARLTDRRPASDDERAALLNAQLRLLEAHLPEEPPLTVICFQPDGKKAGGRCRTVSGTLRRIDFTLGLLLLRDGGRIPLSQVVALDSPLFPAPVE